MKKYLIKLFLLAGVSTVLFTACKKEENKIYYTGGTAPILTASLHDTIPLIPADSTQNIISFLWTNPNYSFTDGLSSQSVGYYLEFDTLGGNFTTPKHPLVSVGGSALDTTLTVGAINSILANDLGLTLGMQHNVQVRLQSYLGGGAAILYSSPLTYNITPYAPPPKVAPPASGVLYIIGSALASGWTNAPTQTNQQFTQVTPTLYEITVPMIGGQEYDFIPTYGSWADKYAIATTDDPALVNGGTFQWQGNNILAPATSGTYKISVNFQTGIFTVTPQ